MIDNVQHPFFCIFVVLFSICVYHRFIISKNRALLPECFFLCTQKNIFTFFNKIFASIKLYTTFAV